MSNPKTIKFVVPSSSLVATELCLGQLVEVMRDPYDEPLPVRGILCGVRIEPNPQRGTGDPVYKIQVMVQEEQHNNTRVFDLDEAFVEPVNPVK
jgi:hypothetical protein